jgi:outer membrane receptor protein involved in Fe transport
MVNNKRILPILSLLILAVAAHAAEQAGGIRGMVYDTDFDVPLAAALVSIAETGAKTTASDQGNYVFSEVAPGTYTLVFSKDGYVRQVKANIVVSSGKMTEVDASLSGDFTEMEEFVVQDVQVGAGSEAALLDLRLESPAMMDSVGSELMSRAGAGDAASALRLVAGASVQDGKYAVVRGLPDRYVNSQMNGVRLPTADADKRAVQLDQFPSAAIESIQVTKTFTPDQQGDASGGAVNVILKGIPDGAMVKLGGQYSWNTLVQKAGDDFLSYRGGGVNTWAKDDNRKIQSHNVGGIWDGAAGVSPGDAPTDYKWSATAGNKWDFRAFRIGALGSYFYERNSSHLEGIDDQYWVDSNGNTVPKVSSSDPANFNSSLFDVTQSSQEARWGGLGVLGLETENHAITLTYLYTRSAEDTATLAENTRGKEYFFPGHNPNDPTLPGFSDDEGNDLREASPYLRTETIEYTERTTQTLQLSGRHTLPDPEIQIADIVSFLNPKLEWTIARSEATLYQPDKRQLGTLWKPGLPDIVTPWGTIRRPAAYLPYQPAVNINIGNYQRIWKDISEESGQYRADLKLPFEQWSGDEGYLKTGLFFDKVDRTYEQSSYANRIEDLPGTGIERDWSESVSEDYDYPLYKSNQDIDYDGRQDIWAWYQMADIPLTSNFNIIGGARFESTELEIVNHPYDEQSVQIVLPGSDDLQDFDPEKANVQFDQQDVLPSLGFKYNPWKTVTLHGSYSETVARQTFKELSPITQMEYLGGDVFIGNPELKMSSLKNYDLRLDWAPYQGGLLSVSWFKKDVADPIEYVQRYASFDFTTPRNYPEGKLSGYEFEVRQEMGRFWQEAQGLGVGANATFIDSEVTLPDDESDLLSSVGLPMDKRDMTNAPEHLYNIFTTYDIEKTGTQIALFYTVRGDTLVAGAGQSKSHPVNNVYETEYGTLNLSVSQKLGEIWKFTFQAKNLLDPDIETVYRSESGDDTAKNSYKKGMDFSISFSASF